MIVFGFERTWRWGLCAMLIIGVSESVLLPEDTNPVDEIIQKAATKSDSAKASRGYTYTKVSVTEELDPAGRVKERREKVFQISSQGGLSHARLVEVNGHAPANADLKKQGEADLNIRQLLGGKKPAKGENRENFLTPELVERFDFTLLAQEPVNGRKAFKISFRPKVPSPPVHRLVDRLLNRLSGILWIDAEEYEIARADIHLGSEVDFFGGIAGCLRKLAYTVTRTRLAEGVWLNSCSSGDFEGRKLLDSKRIKMNSRTSDFRLLASG